MNRARFQPEDFDPAQPSSHRGPGPARLNLLLSYAGWRAESWADRLPRLLEPMGIQSLRAGTGLEASDVIRQYTVHIAVVDLGLPLDASAGSGPGGPRLLELLRRLDEPPPTVVVKRKLPGRDESRDLAAALDAGAFAVIDRPHDADGMETLLEVLRRALRRFYEDRWPGEPA